MLETLERRRSRKHGKSGRDGRGIGSAKEGERERERPTGGRQEEEADGTEPSCYYSVMCLMLFCCFCCTRVGRERQANAGQAQESKFWAMAGTPKLAPATKATTQHNARSLAPSRPWGFASRNALFPQPLPLPRDQFADMSLPYWTRGGTLSSVM